MIWHNFKPKSNFEDAKSEKLISLLPSLNSFGIILNKKDHGLSLYLGAENTESHHITGLSDVTSIPHESLDISSLVTQMKLKNDYIHPLCVAPQQCKIYEQSSYLSDFTLGITGRRIDPKIVRRKAKLFLDKISKRKTIQIEMTKSIQWKLEQNSFFVTSIFFSYEKNSIPSFLSSVNFTNRLSEPNALLAKKNTPKTISFNPPKLSWFKNSKALVLSPVEMVSVLSLPPSMFGLKMESGADKTFSNLRRNIADPADFFSDLTNGKNHEAFF